AAIQELHFNQQVALKKAAAKPVSKPVLKRSETNSSGKIPEDYDPTQTSSIFTKPTILAKHFPFSRKYAETPFLSKVKIQLLSQKEGAVFKVRVFDVDADGSPGADVLPEDVIVTTRQGEYIAEVDLSGYGIRF